MLIWWLARARSRESVTRRRLSWGPPGWALLALAGGLPAPSADGATETSWPAWHRGVVGAGLGARGQSCPSCQVCGRAGRAQPWVMGLPCSCLFGGGGDPLPATSVWMGFVLLSLSPGGCAPEPPPAAQRGGVTQGLSLGSWVLQKDLFGLGVTAQAPHTHRGASWGLVLRGAGGVAQWQRLAQHLGGPGLHPRHLLWDVSLRRLE